MAVKTSSARRLRKVAAGCSVLGVLLVIAMVYCAFSGPHELVIPYLCEGVAFLLLGIGLGSGLKVLDLPLEEDYFINLGFPLQWT